MLDLDPRNGAAPAECAQRCVGDQPTNGQGDQLDQPLTMLFVDDDERLRERIGRVLAEPGLHMLLADRHAAVSVLAAARSTARASTHRVPASTASPRFDSSPSCIPSSRSSCFPEPVASPPPSRRCGRAHAACTLHQTTPTRSSSRSRPIRCRLDPVPKAATMPLGATNPMLTSVGTATGHRSRNEPP